MRILVYPHDLDMGGSQSNAIDLAAAVTALGHECVVVGRPGTLVARIDRLGLRFLATPQPGRRPSWAVASWLADLVRQEGFDLIHGYEWPPGLEAAIAAQRSGSAAVCTVMSMAVAPFLPRHLPLVVGTAQIAEHERRRGRTSVHLLEPPVDLAHDRPPPAATLRAFREAWGLDDRPVVVCVGRMVADLKGEGLLSAVEVAGRLARSQPFQLLLVGDGAARSLVQAAADRVNAEHGAGTVVLTGQLADPRPAYGVADVALGMGGSALRSMAFGVPLVVQGERGFFRTLTPESVGTFTWQGWYGVGDDPAAGPAALAEELRPLLADPALRARLGSFSRQVVEEFSLQRAARRQLEVYRSVLSASSDNSPGVLDWLRSGYGYAQYVGARRLARWRGRARVDDFNAHPVAGRGR